MNKRTGAGMKTIYWTMEQTKEKCFHNLHQFLTKLWEQKNKKRRNSKVLCIYPLHYNTNGIYRHLIGGTSEAGSEMKVYFNDGGMWLCVCVRASVEFGKCCFLAFVGKLINPQPFDFCQTPPFTHTHTPSPSVWPVPAAPFNYPACFAALRETSLFSEGCERETDGQTSNTDKDFRKGWHAL